MLELIGRTSSLFTRVPRVFAQQLGVPLPLVVVPDMTQLDRAAYADNPALKLPTLRRPGGALVFGAENIARVLAEQAGAARVAWPEHTVDDESRNAHELARHAMAAQVQWVFGTVVCGLPADNVYFAKGRAGFEGALAWLDAHLASALARLPAPRDLSLLEVMVFCLVEHIAFRGSLPLAPYPALTAFARDYGARIGGEATAYRFDAPAP